jgi:hypothetical protein
MSTVKSSISLYTAIGDRFGIALSCLCLVHCLAVPITLALLPAVIQAPMLGILHKSEWLHAALLVPILLISGPVLLSGARQKSTIGYLAIAGIGALCAAVFIHEEMTEQIITICGAVLLVSAHIANLRYREINDG